MDTYKYIMFFSSIILSVQLLPQNYKIYKKKSAKDISYITIFINLLGVTGIISYGIHMKLIEIWVPPIVQIIFTSHSLLMKIYYDNFYIPEKKIIFESYDNNFTSHVSIGITGIRDLGNNIDHKFS